MKKRFISLVLVSVLIIGLFAGCAKEEAAPATLSIGYGKVDVTPTQSLPLGGYQGDDAPQFRWSTSTEWPFSATCVAITDAKGSTAIIVVLDLLNSKMAGALRDAISNENGVPVENIMIHATHNHSGPATSYNGATEITAYIAQTTNGVLAATKAAMESRSPVTGMYTTYARPEGHNSERHYLLADGSYQSYGVGSVPKDQLIGHYGKADNLLQLIKFTRESGKDVVMVNWQGHPPGTKPNTIATANYAAVLCNYLDKNLDCQSMFFLGGSGNLNNASQIPSEILHDDYVGLGEALGKAGVEAAQNFTQRNIGDVLAKEKVLQLPKRDYGTEKVAVYAFSIGDFAFVACPFEIFDDNAVAVRENSPYVMTMYLSCSNGGYGYLPTPPSFGWAITYEATTTPFPQGTAEFVQDELIGMLKEIATESGYQAVEKAEDYYQAEFVPKTDGKTYTNPAPGDTGRYTTAQNDFFAFQMLNNGKLKNFLCKDEALVKQILELSEVKVIFDVQGVVVGIAE
jgi:hypothetical protein